MMTTLEMWEEVKDTVKILKPIAHRLTGKNVVEFLDALIEALEKENETGDSVIEV